MVEEYQRHRRVVSETYPSKRPWKDGKAGRGKAAGSGYWQSLWETDDPSETSCYRREIRTMERILGLLSTNSRRTLRVNIADEVRPILVPGQEVFSGKQGSHDHSLTNC